MMSGKTRRSNMPLEHPEGTYGQQGRTGFEQPRGNGFYADMLNGVNGAVKFGMDYLASAEAENAANDKEDQSSRVLNAFGVEPWECDTDYLKDDGLLQCVAEKAAPGMATAAFLSVMSGGDADFDLWNLDSESSEGPGGVESDDSGPLMTFAGRATGVVAGSTRLWGDTLAKLDDTAIDLGALPEEFKALNEAVEGAGHIENAQALVNALGKFQNASKPWNKFMEEIKNKEVTTPTRLDAAEAMGDWFASMGPLANLIPFFGEAFSNIAVFNGDWFRTMAGLVDPFLRKNAAEYAADPDVNWGFVPEDNTCKDGSSKVNNLNPTNC